MIKNTLLLLLLLLTVSAFAELALDLNSTLPIDPDLKIGKLPNGMTYYIKVNRKPEKRAELRLVVNVGSVQEDDDQQGLAHFTEHMAFNGTKHFPKTDLVDYLNSIGMGYAAGLNAGTGLDQTVYQLTIPTDNTAQFRKSFIILSDWASGVSFDPIELEKERGVIIEEYRMGQGADQRLRDKINKVLLAGSKYSERSPIGKLDVLQNFQLSTIKRFYNDWYRPDLQAVVAVGDFDATQVENYIIELFGAIPAKANPREYGVFGLADHIEPKAVIATDKEATETSVSLYWKHDKSENKTYNDYRNSLITNLYTNMLDMRLQELMQLANPPYSYAYNFKYNIIQSKSVYSIGAYVPENGIITGLRALVTEGERVNRYGFTQSELDRAKQVALRNAERMLAEKDKQESGRLVWRYVGAFTQGNPVMSIEQNVALNKALYDSITLDDVNRLCKELVTDHNMVITVSAPEKDDMKMPTENDLLAIIKEVNSEVIAPYVDKVSSDELLAKILQSGKVVKEKSYKAVGVKQWTLNNGITVLHKKTDFKNDEVLLKAYSPGGTSLYDIDDLFEAREAAGIITDSGVGNFDYSALKKKLSGKIVNVFPFIENETEGFTANSSIADMETMFQLIYLYATAPRLDEESFSSWMSKQYSWLQNEALDPESSFSDSMYVFAYNRHPRIRQMKADDLITIDMQRVWEVYNERFADFSDFTFVIVGSFDEKALKEYCTKYLANLPAKGRKEKIRDNGVRIRKGLNNMAVYKGQDPKSIVQFILNDNCTVNSKTNTELYNLAFLLNEKLRENIRENRSGVYYIGAWPEIDKFPVSSYSLNIYMQCAPERVEELSLAVVQTLDSLKTGLFAEKYVNTVKITRQKRFETETKENRWWLSSIYNQSLNGFAINDLLKDRAAINHINLKSLQKTAKQYLNHDKNLIRGVLYPFEMHPQN
jgi:zinc protease